MPSAGSETKNSQQLSSQTGPLSSIAAARRSSPPTLYIITIWVRLLAIENDASGAYGNSEGQQTVSIYALVASVSILISNELKSSFSSSGMNGTFNCFIVSVFGVSWKLIQFLTKLRKICGYSLPYAAKLQYIEYRFGVIHK